MFVLEDAGEVLTIGVVEHMKNKRCELKNLVTAQEYRRQGYGTYMVNYLSEYYSVTCDVMYVGTGNNSNTLDFYKQCGFVNSHIVANFFVDHYEKPIYENGIQLTDMIYLKKNLDVVLDVKRVVDMAMHAGRILLSKLCPKIRCFFCHHLLLLVIAFFTVTILESNLHQSAVNSTAGFGALHTASKASSYLSHHVLLHAKRFCKGSGHHL